MKILIEGQKYSISDLELIFDNSNFYTEKGVEAIINSVGYYHSFGKGELVYMLPKVFMKDGNKTIFGMSSDELYCFDANESFKHSENYIWTRRLLIYFYNSLKEYKNRYSDNLLTQTSQSLELNTSLGKNQYTYLDLLLSFVNFYKKNKNTILFKHIEFKSSQARKPKWEKTIRKSTPFLDSSNTPVYLEIANKKKNVNNEEELITYFFSILNHFNKEYQLNLKIDPSYDLIEGNAFERLQNSGLSKLKKIKHRYFSDVLRRMFRLCELYFQHTDLSSIKKKKEEFISVKNYNIIFEDMVDKLFSDELNIKKGIGTESISLNDLKYNNDGKIIDHIYEDQSLIDTSDIFYIGDSKYYKANSLAGKVSQYKQFTYAKNVIQFNIDLLNEGKKYKENIRYRDEITEGYNITPNFFIYGYINDINDFDTPNLNLLSETPLKSFHFEDRLFDRDTLFVHQYQMNFLFILKAYSISNQSIISAFRKEAKHQFRKEFVKFFSDSSKSRFTIYEKEINRIDANSFVTDNFKQLNGKCFYTNENKLLIAQFSTQSLPLDGFNKITINI